MKKMISKLIWDAIQTYEKYIGYRFPYAEIIENKIAPIIGIKIWRFTNIKDILKNKDIPSYVKDDILSTTSKLE